MLEEVAPAQRQQSLRANRNISSHGGRDLQGDLMGHPKLHPDVTASAPAGQRHTVVLAGCKAQIQEMVHCCGSNACAQPLPMLCAQHWSYQLHSLWKRASVTVDNTSSGLPDSVPSHLLCQQFLLPLAGHCALPQGVPRPQHI